MMTELTGPLFTLAVTGLILGYWLRRMSREHRERMAEIEADARRWADTRPIPAAAELLNVLRLELFAADRPTDATGFEQRLRERGLTVTPVLQDGRWQVMLGPITPARAG